jgi:hypothetical protein
VYGLEGSILTTLAGGVLLYWLLRGQWSRNEG